MNKRVNIIIMVCLLLCVILAGCSLFNEKEKIDVPEIQNESKNNKENENNKEIIEIGNVGNKLPVTRAEAARMISLIYNNINEINIMDREIKFTDCNIEKWHDKYINAVVSQKIMSGTKQDLFEPEGYLSLQQAQYLIDRIDKNNKLKIKITDETKDKPISYALWCDLFYKAITNTSENGDILKNFGISKTKIIVMATRENNKELKQNCVITDSGPLYYEGIDIGKYLDNELEILKKGEEIISVLNVSDTSPVIKNAYIVNCNEKEVSIFSGGAERSYYFQTDENNNNENILRSENIGNIADIKINGSNIVDISIYSNKINGEIKSSGNKGIEIEGKGIFNMPADYKVYSIADGNLRWKHLKDVIIGTNCCDYVIKDDKICAIIIKENAKPDKIRVAVNNTGFKSLIHENVSLSCTTDYTVNVGNEKRNYKANENLNINKTENANLFGQNRITVVPNDETGKIILKSVKKAWEGERSPEYRGNIEIALKDNGYTIVNVIDLEQYLYCVVPSEMPSSYGAEAAKVQAVTARSYAYNQYYQNRYHDYGANVDDSVQSQVYNNIPENDISINAVNDTKGLYITYNNQVVAANYFSTSGGVTANSGEIWPNGETKKYPSDTPVYLQSQLQGADNIYGDLSLEDNAYKFFKDKTVKGYDNNINWYRWNVELTNEELSASINSNLKQSYNQNPWFIKTLQEDGTFRSKPIESIGQVKDIIVMKRGKGGNIMEIEISGTEAVIRISTDQIIRKIISPKQYISGGKEILITLNDGSVIKNMETMPSTFYVFDKIYVEENKLSMIKIYGGGYGHGVGMSQNGVKAMTEQGMKFDEIIKHFYKDTEIKNIESL